MSIAAARNLVRVPSLALDDNGKTDAIEEADTVELPALGSEVTIHGLRGRAAHNGSHGRVTRHCKDGAHVEVHLLESGEKLRLRPANLTRYGASSLAAMSSTPKRKELTRSSGALTPTNSAGGRLNAEVFATASSCVAELQDAVATILASWRATQAARDHVRGLLKDSDSPPHRLALDDLERAELGIQCMDRWAREVDVERLVGAQHSKAAAGASGIGRRSRSSTRFRDEVAKASDPSVAPGSPQSASLISTPSSVQSKRSDVQKVPKLCLPGDASAVNSSRKSNQDAHVVAGVASGIQLHSGLSTEPQSVSTAKCIEKGNGRVQEKQMSLEQERLKRESLENLLCCASDLTFDLNAGVGNRADKQEASATGTLPKYNYVSALGRFGKLRGLRLNFSCAPEVVNCNALGVGFSGLVGLETCSLMVAPNCQPESVEGFGNSIAKLTALTSLTVSLSGCKGLPSVRGIGKSFAEVTALRELVIDLSECSLLADVDELGRNLAKLTALRHLSVDLQGCPLIVDLNELAKSLPELGSLETVNCDLSRCTKFARAVELKQGLCKCRGLNDLIVNVTGCQELPASEQLLITSIQELQDWMKPSEKEDPNLKVEVLDEYIEEHYEPTEGEIEEYAEWLGMDLQEDRDLFWIARKGLKEPVPKPWRPCRSGADIFYFNFATGESTWDHPCDVIFKTLYQDKKALKNAGKAAEAAVNDMVSAAIGNMLTSAQPSQPEGVEDLDTQASAAPPASGERANIGERAASQQAGIVTQLPVKGSASAKDALKLGAPVAPAQDQRQPQGSSVGARGRRYIVAFPSRA